MRSGVDAERSTSRYWHRIEAQMLAQPAQQVRAAGAAAADEHRDANRRRVQGREHAAFELGTGDGHDALTES